jgi:tRNA(adenine34) deaminase
MLISSCFTAALKLPLFCKGALLISLLIPTLKPAARQNHEYWMRKAIAEAAKAEAKDEVPIGCVIVKDGKIIARGHNLRETSQDPVGHAELIAIRKAARKLGSWRLLDTVLYVTLEPCTMCMGAVILARIPTVVFGCYDPKGGAAGSIYDLSSNPRLNHRVELLSGILERDCSSILSNFFAELRMRKEKGRTVNK